MRIVPATWSDVDLCLRIQRAAAVEGFRHIFPQHVYPFPEKAIREALVSALADAHVETFIAFEDAVALGSVSVGHGLLRTLYVLPDRWRHGVGSMLHDFALDRLRSADLDEVRLWTIADNTLARSFYERRGWRLTGRTMITPFPPHPLEVEYARSTALR